MAKSRKKEKSPTGNSIEIRYERSTGDVGYYVTLTFILAPTSLSFFSQEDFEWQGNWSLETVWVKFLRQQGSVEFSADFPAEHKSAATSEVERIIRQFN